MALPALLLVAAVLARPEFPGVVEDQLALPCAPPCDLCHDGGPSAATAVQPFVDALFAHGFAGDEATLRDALGALAAVDTDGDGVADVDELVDGTDPNPDGAPFCESPTPTFGCLSTANRPPRAAGALLAALGLVALVRARRSRIRAPRSGRRGGPG